MEWTQQDQAMFENAHTMHSRGDVAGAQALYRTILARFPQHVDSLHLLGAACYQSGDLDSALRFMTEAIRLRPDYAETYSNRGVVLYDLHRYEASLASCEAAIRLKPDYAGAQYNCGNALKAMHRYEAAVGRYDTAIRLHPDAGAFSNRGIALHHLHRYAEALESYAEAIRLRPDYAEAYSNRGVVLYELLRYAEALESYAAAIRLKPDYAEAYVNQGNALKGAMRYAEALGSYAEAIRLRPDYAEARVNASLLQLLMGDFREGWAGYALRWRTPQLQAFTRHFPQPLWTGQFPLSGRTILLHAEQGLGDTIQFCRYVPMVAALGAKVVLEVQAGLVGFLGQLRGVVQVVRQGDGLPPFDCHCPLMSLPLAFGTTLESIPSPGPYLAADPRRVERFARLLGPRKHPRIGLVWSGGHRPDQPELYVVNGHRNIPFDRIAGLAMEGIEFVSLQKGEPAESECLARRMDLWPSGNMVVLTDRLHDFADTAGLVANLDLVIAVDTSVAHLAAAMGRPVWLLSRFDGCWRWLLDRDDSPWYGSVRIYRQERPGDWDGVLRRVARRMRELVGEGWTAEGLFLKRP